MVVTREEHSEAVERVEEVSVEDSESEGCADERVDVDLGAGAEDALNTTFLPEGGEELDDESPDPPDEDDEDEVDDMDWPDELGEREATTPEGAEQPIDAAGEAGRDDGAQALGLGLGEAPDAIEGIDGV